MELLGLGLELLEPALGVDVDGIFGVFANVELGPELLRSLWECLGVSARAKPSFDQTDERRVASLCCPFARLRRPSLRRREEGGDARVCLAMRGTKRWRRGENYDDDDLLW